MRKKIANSRIVVGAIFVTLILTTAYIAVEMMLAPSVAPPGDPYVRIKGDYVLMLAQCALGVLAMLLPDLVEKRLHVSIPSNMLVLYSVFLFCAIFLGEVRDFYYNVPNWDTILHTFSGAMLGALGYSFISFLNNTDRVPFNLSPLFVAVFTFCFAVTLGAIWEIYEFVADGILHTNMQKFMLENGKALIGRAALTDTMKDIIVDCLGALVMAILGYISMKYKKGWLEKLQLRRKRK